MGFFDVFTQDPHTYVKRPQIKRWLAAVEFPDTADERPFTDPHYYSECESDQSSDGASQHDDSSGLRRRDKPPTSAKFPTTDPDQTVVRYTPMSQTFDYSTYDVAVTEWDDPFAPSNEPSGLSYQFSPFAHGGQQEGEYGEYSYSLKPLKEKAIDVPGVEELEPSEDESLDDEDDGAPMLCSPPHSLLDADMHFPDTDTNYATANSATIPSGLPSSAVSNCGSAELRVHRLTLNAIGYPSAPSTASRTRISVVRRHTGLTFVRSATWGPPRRLCIIAAYQKLKEQKAEEKRERKGSKGEGEGKSQGQGQRQK